MIQKEVVKIKVAITSGSYITLKTEGEVESIALTRYFMQHLLLHIFEMQ